MSFTRTCGTVIVRPTIADNIIERFVVDIILRLPISLTKLSNFLLRQSAKPKSTWHFYVVITRTVSLGCCHLRINNVSKQSVYVRPNSRPPRIFMYSTAIHLPENHRTSCVSLISHVRFRHDVFSLCAFNFTMLLPSINCFVSTIQLSNILPRASFQV